MYYVVVLYYEVFLLLLLSQRNSSYRLWLAAFETDHRHKLNLNSYIYFLFQTVLFMSLSASVNTLRLVDTHVL